MPPSFVYLERPLRRPNYTVVSVVKRVRHRLHPLETIGEAEPYAVIRRIGGEAC